MKCKNPACSCSSTVAENFSFGSGELSDNGFWEHGCYQCARAFDEANPDMVAKYGESWPQQRSSLLRRSYGRPCTLLAHRMY